MSRCLRWSLAVWMVATGWSLQAWVQDGGAESVRLQAAPAPPGVGQASPAARIAEAPSVSVRAVLDRYCVVCHNGRLKTAGLMLDSMDADDVGGDPEAWERVVRKLRGRTMPPARRPRPDKVTYAAVAASLEGPLDRLAAAHPNPGRTTAHRLNRTEYTNVIRDLLALEIDATELLPADDADLGFDNMADILSFSPVLLERAMLAARKISLLALGDPTAPLTADTYTVPKMRFQDGRMDEELPFGSRGGLAVRHHFPADAEYDIKILLRRQLYDYIRGLQRRQQLEVRVDGARAKVFMVGGDVPGTPPPRAYAGAHITDRAWEEHTQHSDRDLEVRIFVKAGSHIVGVSFLQGRSERDGVLQPRSTGKHLALTETWSSPSEAPEAAVDRVLITGPHGASGLSETASRKKLLICRPGTSLEEEPCATRILSTLARRAFRRPLTSDDVATLMRFYNEGRSEGGFEDGLRRGLESILVDPEFLFRIERDPESPAPVYRVSDLELASRLSFFLWSSIPDDELLDLAAAGTLSEPAVLEQQFRRMLADARSTALVDNFAAQWLGLRKLRAISPTPELFADFDDNLREAFRRETELFVESQIREDRSVPELLGADYTWVNERLAEHYGIPNVSGSRFRRVGVPDGTRGGILGQGSILTVTSYPTRTSPVVRGHWLLEQILGTPPPPPPPNVPGLPESGEGNKPASVRERLELHRKNPICANCHAPMDPLGFALENYDAIGKWRTTNEAGGPIDASGVFPDGTTFDGLGGLKTVLESQEEQFVTTLTEKLLTYALGRGLEYYDMPQVRSIVRQAAADDYRWSSLLLEIVRSVPFQMRGSES